MPIKFTQFLRIIFAELPQNQQTKMRILYMLHTEVQLNNHSASREWAKRILNTPVKIPSAYIDYIKKQALLKN